MPPYRFVGTDWLRGDHFVTALVQMGLVPDKTTRVVITADVTGMVELEHTSYLDSYQAEALLDGLVVTDDPAEARPHKRLRLVAERTEKTP